jgi:hypothetical protein
MKSLWNSIVVTYACTGLCGVAQVSNCKIGKGTDAHVLVSYGASTRIDAETCAIRVKGIPLEILEPTKSCFQLMSRHSTSKLSDVMRSALWCDHISFSNPLLQRGMKRRMSAGSVISLCDISEDLDCISNSFTQNFPHLPPPAVAAAGGGAGAAMAAAGINRCSI